MSERRLPPPWSAEETDACFIVRDANGQALAYVYFEEEPGRRSAAKLLTRDEARRIPANIASCRSCLRRSCWHRPQIVPYPLIGQGPSTAAAGLAVALGNYPSWRGSLSNTSDKRVILPWAGGCLQRS